MLSGVRKETGRVCGKPPLQKGHCFDRARSGYVNLLLANRMHAKLPGDNREMVAARSRFLEGGYYAPLQNALCEQVLAFLPQMQAPVLLDSGCGEGYYTAAVAHAVHQAAPGASVLGADISKAALSAAAKRTKEAAFAVASAFALPVPDDSVDILTSVFFSILSVGIPPRFKSGRGFP